jgi:hypothetical protein
VRGGHLYDSFSHSQGTILSVGNFFLFWVDGGLTDSERGCDGAGEPDLQLDRVDMDTDLQLCLFHIVNNNIMRPITLLLSTFLLLAANCVLL